MNIQLLSDLHLEFYPDHGKAFVEALDPTGVDVLVLAGDISTAYRHRLRKALGWLSEMYPQVVVVLGNHEYYQMGVKWTHAEMNKIVRNHIPKKNVHWLENGTVEIGGQRFVGTTLWFREHPDGLNEMFSRYLNDFRMIRDLEPWVYMQNRKAQSFLRETVSKGDFVITHHLPTSAAVHPKWRTDRHLERFYVCDLPEDVLMKPAFWVYGHTHESMSFELGDTRFYSNPCGYHGIELNPNFNPRLILPIK